MQEMSGGTTKPILFSPPMVRAILDGSKFQTRRIVKPQPRHAGSGWTALEYFGGGVAIECGPDYPDDKTDRRVCPYGAEGSVLWVRETWAQSANGVLYYRADGERQCCLWRPSIHMRRSACRLRLEITRVRVQQLGDISEEDVRAEGVASRSAFRHLWQQINGEWDPGLWVWVLTFAKKEGCNGYAAK